MSGTKYPSITNSVAPRQMVQAACWLPPMEQMVTPALPSTDYSNRAESRMAPAAPGSSPPMQTHSTGQMDAETIYPMQPRSNEQLYPAQGSMTTIPMQFCSNGQMDPQVQPRSTAPPPPPQRRRQPKPCRAQYPDPAEALKSAKIYALLAEAKSQLEEASKVSAPEVPKKRKRQGPKIQEPTQKKTCLAAPSAPVVPCYQEPMYQTPVAPYASYVPYAHYAHYAQYAQYAQYTPYIPYAQWTPAPVLQEPIQKKTCLDNEGPITRADEEDLMAEFFMPMPVPVEKPKPANKEATV